MPLNIVGARKVGFRMPFQPVNATPRRIRNGGLQKTMQ